MEAGSVSNAEAMELLRFYLKQCRQPSSEVLKFFSPCDRTAPSLPTVPPQSDPIDAGEGDEKNSADGSQNGNHSRAPHKWLPLPSTRSRGNEKRFRPNEIAPSLYLGAMPDVSNILKLCHDLLNSVDQEKATATLGATELKEEKSPLSAFVAGSSALTTDVPHLLYLVVNACIPSGFASRLELRCVTRAGTKQASSPPKPGSFAARTAAGGKDTLVISYPITQPSRHRSSASSAGVPAPAAAAAGPASDVPASTPELVVPQPMPVDVPVTANGVVWDYEASSTDSSELSLPNSDQCECVLNAKTPEEVAEFMFRDWSAYMRDECGTRVSAAALRESQDDMRRQGSSSVEGTALRTAFRSADELINDKVFYWRLCLSLDDDPRDNIMTYFPLVSKCIQAVLLHTGHITPIALDSEADVPSFAYQPCVVVHCMAGISRSATFTALFLLDHFLNIFEAADSCRLLREAMKVSASEGGTTPTSATETRARSSSFSDMKISEGEVSVHLLACRMVAEVLKFMRQARPFVQPNKGFQKQLETYVEKRLAVAMNIA